MLWLLQHSLRVRAHKSVVFEKNSKMLTGPTSSRVRTKECINICYAEGMIETKVVSTRAPNTHTQPHFNTPATLLTVGECRVYARALPSHYHHITTTCACDFMLCAASYASSFVPQLDSGLLFSIFVLNVPACVCDDRLLDLCWICLYTHCFRCIVTKSFKARGEKKEHTKDLNL